MSDEIDRANDIADQMLRAQLTVRKHDKLLACGLCHSCSEFLPKVGQLFCGTECREDYENEDRLRKQAGKTG
jgi:hypothetical protein